MYLYVVDDGNGVVSGGGRVREGARGEGHFTRFVESVVPWFSRNRHVQRHVWKSTAFLDDVQIQRLQQLRQRGELNDLLIRVKGHNIV